MPSNYQHCEITSSVYDVLTQVNTRWEYWEVFLYPHISFLHQSSEVFLAEDEYVSTCEYTCAVSTRALIPLDM